MSKIPSLDTCGCCKGIMALTPAKVENRPGLSALAYRIGTHASFKATLQSALSLNPVLRHLTTRENDDPTMALLDAWATVLDVLTFYQERIANEGYLRTAVERRSVLELARAIGYELSPGVAASTYLAFTLEEAKGAPEQVTLDIGLKVQSQPGPGEQAQTFETVEQVEARPAWNAMPPRLTEPRAPHSLTMGLYLKGINTGLKPGDLLLVVGHEREISTASDCWDLRRVLSVSPDSQADRTRVTWERGLGHCAGTRFIPNTATDLKVYAFRQRAAAFGYNAPHWKAVPESVKKAYQDPPPTDEWPNFALTSPIHLDAIYAGIVPGSWVALTIPGGQELYTVTEVAEDAQANFMLTAKTTRLTLSGENLSLFEGHRRDTVVLAQSEELPLAETPVKEPLQGNQIVLGRRVEGLGSGKKLIVKGKRMRVRFAPVVSVIEAASVQSLAAQLAGAATLAQQATVMASLLLAAKLPAAATMAQVAAAATGPLLAKLPAAELSLTADMAPESSAALASTPPEPMWSLVGEARPVPGHGLLQQWYVTDWRGALFLAQAQPAQVTYLPAEKDDPEVCEVVTLAEDAEPAASHTTLKLKEALRNVYDPATVTVYGNVALATHGETRREVLGSGDGSQAFQQFTLKQAPLTYVSSARPGGAESTLRLRVNDLLWQEKPALYGLGSRERSYVVRIGDDGKAVIEFGDGITGARPPSGTENVVATYRVGTGLAGMVKAGQLSMLMTRPLGVKEVTNPAAATGAADPESRDDARQNAPFAALTLGRIVSLSDFEDFARAFAGIGKAQATWLWSGEKRVVHITVAAANGDVVDKDSTLYKNLTDAVNASRDCLPQVLIDSYRPLKFAVKARVAVESDALPDKVLAAVSEALLQAFSFRRRALGQPVTHCQVLAVMQGVPGVRAVYLDQLYIVGTSAGFHEVLRARRAESGSELLAGTVSPAELLTLSRDGITLTGV